MLDRAQHMIERAGKKLGMSEAEITELLKPDAEHQFEITTESGKTLPAACQNIAIDKPRSMSGPSDWPENRFDC